MRLETPERIRSLQKKLMRLLGLWLFVGGLMFFAGVIGFFILAVNG